MINQTERCVGVFALVAMLTLASCGPTQTQTAPTAPPPTPAITATPRDEAERLYREATIDRDQAKYDVALDKLARAIAIRQGDYADAYVARARVFLAQDKLDVVIAECKKAIDREPKHADAHYFYGYALLQNNDAKRALDHFDIAIQYQTGFLRQTYFYRGQAHARLQQHEIAIEDFSEAARLYKGSGKYRSGIVERMKSNYALARWPQVIDDCVVLGDTNNYDSHLYCGLAYGQQNDAGNALKHYGQAIELNHDDTEARYYRGVLAWEFKLRAQVIADLTFVMNHLDESPRRTDCLFYLGMANEGANEGNDDSSKAMQYLQAYVRATQSGNQRQQALDALTRLGVSP